MSKKRGCPSAATLEQQIGLNGFDEILHINDDYKSEHGPVSSLLLPGRSNAITLQTLEKWMGLDGRTIRRMIGEERKKLIPIVHDNHTGYYLAETEHEKKMCVRSMENRAKEILLAAAAIDRADIWRG